MPTFTVFINETKLEIETPYEQEVINKYKTNSDSILQKYVFYYNNEETIKNIQLETIEFLHKELSPQDLNIT